MSEELSTIEKTVLSDYKYGFVTDIEADAAPMGLSEDIVRFISAKKKRAPVDAGLEIESLSPLVKNGRTYLGQY